MRRVTCDETAGIIIANKTTLRLIVKQRNFDAVKMFNQFSGILEIPLIIYLELRKYMVQSILESKMCLNDT